jgi:hypothetical protein
VGSHATVVASWVFASGAIRFRQISTINLNRTGRHALLIEGEVILIGPPPILRSRRQLFAHRGQVHRVKPLVKISRMSHKALPAGCADARAVGVRLWLFFRAAHPPCLRRVERKALHPLWVLQHGALGAVKKARGEPGAAFPAPPTDLLRRSILDRFPYPRNRQRIGWIAGSPHGRGLFSGFGATPT